MKSAGIDGVSQAVKGLSPQKQKENTTNSDFENMLYASIKKVNALQLQSNKAIEHLAAGKEENIHETMIAMEKARISFEMMMQIRNKILEAYQEVMRTAL